MRSQLPVDRTESARPAEPSGSRGGGRGSGSALRRGLLSLVGGLVQAFGGLLLTLVVARGLGVTQAGVFFVSVGLFTVLSNTFEFGADTGLVRAIPRLRTLGRPQDLSRTVLAATAPVLIGSAVGAGLVTRYAGTLARVFMEQGNDVLGASFLRTIAPYLLLAPLSVVLLAGTRGFGTVVPFVAVQNGFLALVRPLVIGVLVWASLATNRSVALAWGLPWVVAVMVGGAVLAMQLRQARPTGAATAAPRRFRELTPEFWTFAGPRAFAGTAEVTLVWLDVLLVGWLVGPVQAGIYATASRFVTAGTLGLSASRVAITPRLARALTAGRDRDAERLYHGGAQAVVATSWPLYLGLACFAPVILRIFGHGFGHGAAALTILALAMLVDTATGNVGSVLLMSGRSRWNVINAFSALAVDVVIDLLLIPGHSATSGATGASIGWAASIFVLNLLQCLEVHFLMRLRLFDAGTIRTALLTLACFGVPGAVLGIAAPCCIWALGAWIAIGCATYGVYWWRRRHGAEITALRQAIGLG